MGKRAGWEYLVRWEGYGTEGDTWLGRDKLPKKLVKDWDATYNLETQLIMRRIRSCLRSLLDDAKEPVWKRRITFDATITPWAAATAMTRIAEEAGVELKKFKGRDGKVKLQLSFADPEQCAKVVMLHLENPQEGVGNVVIRPKGARLR